MGLRGKMAAVFTVLLIAVILAVSALEIERVTRVMVAALGDSGAILIEQTFEQLKPQLARGSGDPATAIHNNAALHALLDSSQAFGRGVVYVRIEDRAGRVIAAVPTSLEGMVMPPVPSFAMLQALAASPWFPLHRTLWSAHTFEMSRTVEVNGQSCALIKVGLSTGLIADEMGRSVRAISEIGGGAIVLCLLGVTLFGTALVRPVIEMTTSVERLVSGHDDINLRLGGHDELSNLAQKFNQLSQRLKADRTRWENECGRFFNIFRSIADATILLDNNGAILFANAQARTRLGLSSGATADGKPLSLLLGRDHPLSRTVETVYAVGTEVHDVALQLGNGSAEDRVLVSIFSLGQGPEPPGLLIIVRDLKPVQELENVINYSGRLARLGGLISGVAHQIRNPLNAMNLQLELLSQDAERDRPVDSHVQTVRKEIRRLDQAVEALLRFMRPEQLRLDQVALNDLLHEVVSQVARPSIHVDYQLDPLLPLITADRVLLSEAIRNVVTNAVQAMPGEGTLTLTSALQSGGLVEISINDHGCGIPSDQIEHIFDLYFTTKEGGTGLGLSLALRAIDLHGGAIDVTSEVGAGTNVRIRLPLALDATLPRLTSAASLQ